MALTQLGRVHGAAARRRGTGRGAEWLNRESPVNQGLITALYAGFIDRYHDQISPEHRDVCERLVEAFDAYMAEEAESDRPSGLVHGDFRLDNMLFGERRRGPATDRRGLADRDMGPGLHRRRVLPRLRSTRDAAPRAVRLAAARLPRRARCGCAR